MGSIEIEEQNKREHQDQQDAGVGWGDPWLASQHCTVAPSRGAGVTEVVVGTLVIFEVLLQNGSSLVWLREESGRHQRGCEDNMLFYHPHY